MARRNIDFRDLAAGIGWGTLSIAVHALVVCRNLDFRKVAVYAAIVSVPWALIIAAALFLSGCASPLVISDDPAPPPAAAVYWAVGLDLPADRKDCNQYAREAFARLTAQGLHPRYVAAITETSEGHMFVEAQGWAYDNLRSRPVPLSWLSYRMVEASGDGRTWFKIGGVS
jgi:hypothetical protein